MYYVPDAAGHLCDREDSEGFLAFSRSLSPIRSLTKLDGKALTSFVLLCCLLKIGM